jgi:hypothetical protein
MDYYDLILNRMLEKTKYLYKRDLEILLISFPNFDEFRIGNTDEFLFNLKDGFVGERYLICKRKKRDDINQDEGLMSAFDVIKKFNEIPIN